MANSELANRSRTLTAVTIRYSLLRSSFELCNHVLDAGDGLDLVGMGRLEILDQWPLAAAAENGEVVHLIARRRDARVVAAADLDRRAIDHLIGVPEPVVVDLQELQPEAVLRPKAEIVDLVMVALDGRT